MREDGLRIWRSLSPGCSCSIFPIWSTAYGLECSVKSLSLLSRCRKLLFERWDCLSSKSSLSNYESCCYYLPNLSFGNRKSLTNIPPSRLTQFLRHLTSPNSILYNFKFLKKLTFPTMGSNHRRSSHKLSTGDLRHID